MMPPVQAALELAARGVPVFPCNADRSPACAGGFYAASTDPERVRELFAGADGAPLIGVPTGPASGLDVLDLDPRHGSDAWSAEHGPALPATRQHRTGRGGVHLLFRHVPGLRCSAGTLAPGCDVRTEGGYVVWWPAAGLEANGPAPAEWPEWLLSRLRAGRPPSAAGVTRGAAKLAPPSAAAVVALLNRLPNPLEAGRDVYVRVMLAAKGCIDGLEAAGALGEGEAEAIRDAAVSWAERWEGGAAADEAEKWGRDWATRDAPLAGWRTLEAVAGQLVPGFREEQAAVDFSGTPAPEVAEDPECWRTRLLLTGRGKPQPVLANAMLAFSAAPEWRGALAYDEFAARPVLRRAPPWHAGPWRPRELRDSDVVRAAEWLQLAGVLLGPGPAGDALAAVAEATPVHPVRDYLAGLRWDGLPRLDGWLVRHLGAEDSPFVRAVGARFLISAVARVHRPGCKVDSVLILEGRQGLRKSSALATLARGWFTDHMPDLSSKDAAMQLMGVWLVEFAELDKLHRAEAARAKAFISTGTDRLRRPFGKLVGDHPRQCVFAGTVNPGAVGYLRDETGNRRFWPVLCGVGWDAGRRVDLARLEAETGQLWAEAAARYHAGEPWWLDAAELDAAQAQAAGARLTRDAWHERIADYLERQAEVTVGMVLGECLLKPAAQWTDADAVRVGRVLTALGWERRRVRIGGGQREYRYVRGEGATPMTPEPAPFLHLVGTP